MEKYTESADTKMSFESDTENNLSEKIQKKINVEKRTQNDSRSKDTMDTQYFYYLHI